MSLKENIDSVKAEIGAQEQFLESMIKGERFYKKYKRWIQITVVLIVVGAISYASYDYIQKRDIRISNEAYETLIKSPNDSKAMTILKDKNPSLYEIFLFKKAVKEKDIKELKKLSNSKKNYVLSDISTYELSQLQNSKDVNSELLKGFSLLEEGFDLLKDGKITQARLKFAQIDPNSPLLKIVKNLEHYQGKIKGITK